MEMSNLFDLCDLNKQTQQHLTKVYAALGGGILLSMGSFFASQAGLIPIPLVLASILSVTAIIGEISLWCMTKNSQLYNRVQLFTFLAYPIALGFSFGGGIALLAPIYAKVYAKLLFTALIDTFAVFASFSVFALLTSKRLGIYVGATIVCLVLSIINIFVYNVLVEMVIGIIIACLYVIIDTQSIILRCNQGDSEVIRDAKMLFIDFAQLFIKIFEILTKNQKEEEKKKK